MEICYKDNNRSIKCIYWKDSISLDDVEGMRNSCDELQIWYPKKEDLKIAERYGEILSIIEGEEYTFGNVVYSKYIDLMKTKEEILTDFNKTRRYEVRRAAERDFLNDSLILASDACIEDYLESYYDFYNKFAAQKSRLPIIREKVQALVKNDMFALGIIYDENGQILVENGYIIYKDRDMVSLYTSSSLFRGQKEKASLLGRANAFLHYKMMCLFKDMGFRKYDLGGYYIGDRDEQRKNISGFKNSLGGVLEDFQTGFTIRLDELGCVENTLKSLEDIIKKNKIVIYGAGLWGRYVIRRIKEIYDISPYCVIDNNLCKANKMIFGKEYLEDLNPSEILILVTTGYGNYQKICCEKETRPFYDVGKVFCMKIDNNKFA